MKFEHFRNNLYWINLLKIKKQKLKLGLVSFEIIPIFFNGFKIYEYSEMRYSRQDMTKEDESKLSTRLEKLKWKWTFSHLMALLIILLIFYNYFYVNIYLYYFNLILPSGNFFSNPSYNTYLNNIIFNVENSSFFKKSPSFNFKLNSFLLEFINL